ncbi:hypothetical protein H310_12953 [Aphanomyces invadans]|uniref:Chorein N-terminal domain-containing protein n=1 Tax=Aphanomyces invadans TaxID=157072 RepID=A0A024THA5_9STRA|nr:hypothetical protein H310_12953 [Aphanomyces invadans]ETV92956.1 hypothetical protein H310_12953 [Aphanomyces invadans]|eukprot:XP_008878477.1 hypothetical protein H310_12953 [Aphanomyces invadans]
MVLEGLVAALVQQFCSRFVKGFRKQNLRIELSGEITLTDIELELDTFKSLQLPLEPKRIHVGHLRSNFVAAHFSNQPLHMQAEDVTILLGTPSSLTTPITTTDVLADMDAAHQAKIDWLMRLLADRDDMDASRNSRLPVNSPPTSHGGASRWLQLFLCAFVSLERVHVRVEAGATSAGVRFDAILVQPANKPNPTPSDAPLPEHPTALSKSIQVANASLYVEESRRHAKDSPSHDQTTAVDAADVTTHCIVCVARVEIDLAIHESSMQVQATVSVPPPPVRVNLSLTHLQALCALLHTLDTAIRASLYRRFRPVHRPITARAWWRYAIFATLLQQNDPVFQRPSWPRTINLVLVGLQYTAVRRALQPYIERTPFASKNGYVFNHVERVRVDGVDVPAVPLVMTAALHNLPSAVTCFGNAVFGGLYGVRGMQSTVQSAPRDLSSELHTANAVTTLQRLWSRQLYLDACFRPIVAAKLRLLANEQLRKQEHVRNVAQHTHNKARGALVVTVVECHWRDGGVHSSFFDTGMAFLHIKVGTRGRPYNGPPVPCHRHTTSPSCCSCIAANTTIACVFGQSFEFHLNGTPDEDVVHIVLYDKWIVPYLHQASATASLAIPPCTSTSEPSRHDVALPQDSGHVHVLTTFLPHDDGLVDGDAVQAAVRTHVEQLHQDVQHTWMSWYTPPMPGHAHGVPDAPPPALDTVAVSVPAIHIEIQLGQTAQTSFSMHLHHVTCRRCNNAKADALQVRVDEIQCRSSTPDIPWLRSTTRPALHVALAAATKQHAESTWTLGSLHLTTRVPTMLILYTTVLQWKQVALDVLAMVVAPIYGPFGLWVAPPAVHVPQTPATITTHLALAHVSVCVEEFGTFFAAPSKLLMVTKGNATCITNEAGRPVGSLHWDLWQRFLRHVEWAWNQPDLAGSMDGPSLMDDGHRQPSFLWMAQGISVLKHNSRRGLPQERTLWLGDRSIFIGKSRFKTGGVRELPMHEITQLMAGQSSTALRRTGSRERAALYLTLVHPAHTVSLEFAEVGIRQLAQRTLADVVAASRERNNPRSHA